jgi:hypothetical protein
MLLRRFGLALTLLAASGCGGAAQGDTRTTPTDDPCVERVRARDEASAALSRCREAVPAWRHEAAYGTALGAVQSLAAIRGPVSPADAQRAADAVWELLDAVSPELTNHVALDRAENAAEALLRDREGDAARAAVTEAESSLTELRAVLAPEPAEDPCAAEQARVEETTAAASSCS